MERIELDVEKKSLAETQTSMRPTTSVSSPSDLGVRSDVASESGDYDIAQAFNEHLNEE